MLAGVLEERKGSANLFLSNNVTELSSHKDLLGNKLKRDELSPTYSDSYVWLQAHSSE